MPRSQCSIGDQSRPHGTASGSTARRAGMDITGFRDDARRSGRTTAPCDRLELPVDSCVLRSAAGPCDPWVLRSGGRRQHTLVQLRITTRCSTAPPDRQENENNRFIATGQAGIKIHRSVCLTASSRSAADIRTHRRRRSLSRTRSNTSMTGLWRLFRRHCEAVPRKPELGTARYRQRRGGCIRSIPPRSAGVVDGSVEAYTGA